MPGFVFVEAFFHKLPGIQKIQLYLLVSVIISSFLSYFLGVVFGFSRLSLILGLILTTICLIWVVWIRKVRLHNLRKELGVIACSLFVYIIFLVALYPAIFKPLNGQFVMSGPNWQDTAMHLSIIETIAQGNFPPQAPYFSGAQLSYYYFVDFHSALINTFFGQFFPRVLVYVNPFFAMLFFVSMYNLSFQLTKNKLLSIAGAFAAVLFSNIGFIEFFKDLLQRLNVQTLLIAQGYGYTDIFQMVPVSNYFLQNRPMMYGLPAVATAVLYIFKFFEEKNYKYALIVGMIVASLYKFQLFGLAIASLVVLISAFVYLLARKVTLMETLRFIFISFSFLIFLFLVFPNPQIGDRNLLLTFSETFKWGAWEKHPLAWFIKFTFMNFGLAFVFAVLSLFSKKVCKNINLIIVYLLMVILFVIPFSMNFTIYAADMFKFFYYMVIFMSILAIVFVSTLPKKLIAVLLPILLFVTVTTSLLNLGWSFLNKNIGYSKTDYESGIWIRQNTPKNSVFIELPKVHSSVSDIGGRLRIISYITWPHSHGFNVGADNVFSRRDDVEYVYKTGNYEAIAKKYSAKYIFLGNEEKSTYPGVQGIFDMNQHLQKVYNSGNITIYEIID